MKGGIHTKHKDAYVKTRRTWDKRYLITVSTHLRREDKTALEDYCRTHDTTPYRLLRSYLMDCIGLAKYEKAKAVVELMETSVTH